MTATSTILRDARVDLVDLIASGIPEREWLPGSPLFLRAKRYLMLAPAKSGKSLVALVHAIDIVLAGGRVAILDRENGADEYARRLQDIANTRPGLDLDRLRDGLVYFAFPALKLEHGGEPLATALKAMDLVILDSSRGFLSASGLGENDSDEYARFMGALVDPLAQTGITTLILDNTGHGDQARGRGTSSKADLNEVVLVAKPRTEFDRRTAGVIDLDVTHTRFAEIPRRWQMAVGGGAYGPLEIREDAVSDITADVLDVITEQAPISKSEVARTIGGQRQVVWDEIARLLETGAVGLDKARRLVPSESPVPTVLSRSVHPQAGSVPGVPAIGGGTPRNGSATALRIGEVG